MNTNYIIVREQLAEQSGKLITLALLVVLTVRYMYGTVPFTGTVPYGGTGAEWYHTVQYSTANFFYIL